jgi:type IV pilus assembly protein PilX
MSRIGFAARQAQCGAILFIALIVLVAMSLAGLALMRGVDTGTLIASNLAFKQSATAAGDLGIEAGRNWLLSNGGPSLYVDMPGSAYYSTFQTNVDLVGGDPTKTPFDWTTATSAGTDAAGNQVSYVIQRLCDLPGDPATVNCIRASGASSTSASTKGAAAYGGYAISAPTGAFYRITVRVLGPRNTVSIVQATVY